MAIEGQFPKVDGDILYASETNYFNNSIWTKVTGYDANIDDGLISFSSTKFQTRTATSSDTGATWSAGGYGATAGEDIAATSGTAGIAVDQSDGSTSFTTNSGDTWTASSTQPANISIGNSLSMASTTIGVLVGDAGTGASAWFTTDGGDNWTQSTSGPTTEFTAVIMASSTVGYAVLTGTGAIWKTIDGGDNWSDTTDILTAEIYSLHAISTDIIISLKADASTLGRIEKYVNSTNTVTILFAPNGGDVDISRLTNIVQATNGDYYWVYYGGNNVGDVCTEIMTLFRYDGTNIFMRPISMAGVSNMSTQWSTATMNIPSLIEASNVLYLNAGGDSIIQIPVNTN